MKSSLQFKVDQRDDGVAYTCSVEHVALSNPYMTTEVLEVHCEYSGAASKAGLRPRQRNASGEGAGRYHVHVTGLALHLPGISAGLVCR